MRQRIGWIVVVLLSLAAPARAVELDWSNSDLTRKFEEVDKKLKTLPDLAVKDRVAARRLGDLEAAVRDLRTSVRKVLSRLNSLDSSLASIQKNLDKLAEAAQAKPEEAEPEAGPSTSRKPVEPEGPLAEIVGSRRVVSGEFLTITGSVRNLSDRALTFVVVRATFVGSQGNIVKTESAYTNPRVIGPGARGTFKIVTRRNHRIRDTRLSVRAK